MMLRTDYLQLQTAVATHQGLVRSENQDACLLLPERGLYILADGMGGHSAGALAAQRVIEYLPREISAEIDTLGGLDDVEGDVQRPEVLRLAVQKVSQQIYSEGARSLETQGMGSTLVMVWLHKQLATLAHVGDSRIYLWRNGRLKPLTIDHSVGNALLQLNQVTPEDIEKNARLRNLSRCMGMARDVEPEISQLVLKENDYLLLCSDGLTNMVSEDWISAVIGREQDLDWTCEMLVEAANHAGGIDNISVILLRWGNVE
jgi:protein phosphatase